MAGSRGVCRSLHRAHPSSFHAYWFAKQTSPLDASREILFLQLKLTLQWAGLREGTTLLKALPAHPWMSISLLAGTHLCQGSCPAMLQSGTAPRNRIPWREATRKPLQPLGPAITSPSFQEGAVRKFLLCLFFITQPQDGHCHSSPGRGVHSSCWPSKDH